MSAIRPFELRIPEAELDDLRRRLGATRWPDREPVPDRSQGAQLAFVQDMCAYWADGYDWRRCEAMLNGFGQFRTEIDGLDFHFLHVRSPQEGARPLIMTHGWPGSIIEFHKVIGPLTDPVAHGGKAEDAFHLVMPSLPGYGLSAKPDATGWNVSRTARAWAELMARLGYTDYFAQGGDWGAMVTDSMGAQAVPGCRGIHVNMVIAFPLPEDAVSPSPREANALQGMQEFREFGSGYQQLQSTRPQTLGYGLADSPAGQAAWILEKFSAWTDSDGDPRTILSMDELLDNVTLYWLTNSATSSARYYWEIAQTQGAFAREAVVLPSAATIFPKEMMRPTRKWAERRMHDIRYWNEVDRGGHFAAFEQPALFVEEVRAAFKVLAQTER